MTISLAAVFIPLVFMSGLVGRIFREFSITIIVSIFASGIVSLTLTPLMCSRLLGQRGRGAKKTWMERVIGGIERRVLGVYGRSLWFFLRNRWVSALVWLVCLFGTVYMFYIVPKAFLPVGDSSFILGVFFGQEGSSPEQMHRYQDAEETCSACESCRGHDVHDERQLWLSSRESRVRAGDSEGPRAAAARSRQLAGQLMGAAGASIPGVVTFLQPNPVLQISTGATANLQGQFAYALSGFDSKEVYDTAGKFMQKMYEFPGFLFVNSDLFNHTPNLQVNILRDQAKLYGVSETRILNLLHEAYSQNYTYLIKKPNNQYQVILEVKDIDRSEPQDLKLLYIKSDDGQRMVPLNAVTTWQSTLGPQAVNHINQFTSVTLFFNLKPGYTIGQATDFVEKSAKEILPPDVRGRSAGRGADVPRDGHELDDPDGARRFRDVRDSGDSLRKLSAPDHGAVVAAGGAGRRVADAVALWRRGVALRVRRHVHADGHREEERNHDRGFRAAASGAGRKGRRGHSRSEHGALPADHDDDDGRTDGRAADRAGLRRGWRVAAAAGTGGGGRADRLAVHHAVRHAGDLSVPRGVPGKGAGPFDLLPPDTKSSAAASNVLGFVEQSRRFGALMTARSMNARSVTGAGTGRFGARLGILTLALASLPGCNVGPKYQRATVETPPAYKETEGWKVAQPQDETIRGKWWETFNDPQLNVLEDQVNISNQNIAAAAASFLSARAMVKQARAQYYPTVSANPTIVYSRQPIFGATINTSGIRGNRLR